MAIIIETCPTCGHDLMNEVICTFPPIPRKSCPNCGWSWEGEQEKVIRVPFGGNSFTMAKDEYDYDDCLNDFKKLGYSEEDSQTLATLAVNSAVPCDGLLDIEEAKNSIVSALNCVDIEKLKDLKQGF